MATVCWVVLNERCDKKNGIDEKEKSQEKRRFKEVEQRCDTCKKNGTDKRKGDCSVRKSQKQKRGGSKKKN